MKKSKILTAALAGVLLISGCSAGSSSEGASSGSAPNASISSAAQEKPTSVVESAPVDPTTDNNSNDDTDIDIANIKINADTMLKEYSAVARNRCNGKDYTICATYKLSPIFLQKDMESLVKLWESMGGNASDIPTSTDFFDWNPTLKDAQAENNWDKFQYVVGTYKLENLSEDNHLSEYMTMTNTGVGLSTLSDGVDMDKYESYRIINRWSTTMFFCPDETVYSLAKDHLLHIAFFNPEMKTDVLGPVNILIVLPDKNYSKYPNGIDYSEVNLNIALTDAEQFTLPTFPKL